MKPNCSQILLLLTFTFVTCWPIDNLWAQFVDYDRLLDHLQIEINAGNPKVLRDLGSLLDNEEAKSRAQKLLINHTLFTTAEMDLKNTVSRQKFLDFFYF